jgi:membrane protease YdiL (CAAX protease family)
MLQVIDYSLSVVGLLVALACGVALARSGRWRNPLAGVEITPEGPGLIGIVGALCAYVFIHTIADWLVFGQQLPDDIETAGSAAWHNKQLAAQVADLATAALLLAILIATRSLRLRPRPTPFWAGTGAALLGLLVLIPLMTLQYHAGEEIWRRLVPATPPPTHIVLQAVHHSAWGTWGHVQLFVGAVVVAPLVEELFFRGILLQVCWQLSRHAGASIVLAGAFFGFMHVSQPQDVAPLATMGILLGYLRFRCGSLWPCILLHLLFNARTMIMALLAPELVANGG